MNIRSVLILLAVAFCFAACSDEPNKQSAAAVIQKPLRKTLEEPFKFHKMVEVAPGRYYDILSWGRGAKGGGAYMILRSDSAEQQYNTVNGDLEGPIQDVLNADLDVDGNPEIIIQAKTIDTNRFTNVFIYEYQGDRANKLEFPRLTVSQRKGFRGNDKFYVKNDTLFRSFPVFEGEGAAAKPGSETRLIAYTLHGSSLSAKQISKDKPSEDGGKTKQAAVENKPKQSTPEKKTEAKSSSRKSHTSSKRKESSKTKSKKQESSHKKRRHKG
ncbi:hypothetical protein MUY27_15800 [Mucilaginibacter sp. RS28]|uniref:PliI/PliC-like inhibitor of I-type lysozyme n=1 Tax=Mucilaginibacter straminoryzae TaxID=2932774 RepID=A0A9X2B9Y6_9SPHI|nr:hypothetical protein [Mucilaginibacter straminoryzae]MCJ8211184.1 hypothetical protein [Mucilaginibacter straminoryzae]